MFLFCLVLFFHLFLEPPTCLLCTCALGPIILIYIFKNLKLKELFLSCEMLVPNTLLTHSIIQFSVSLQGFRGMHILYIFLTKIMLYFLIYIHNKYKEFSLLNQWRGARFFTVL